MKIPLDNLHSFSVSTSQAIEIQKELSTRVIKKGKLPAIKHVAGVDVSIRDRTAVAAMAILSFPGLQLCEKVVGSGPVEFPYVPGLLSFREIPVILDTIQKIKIIPDVILCDGQGIAHPRRLGLASHFGILADIPAIGVAKSRLIGSYDSTPLKKGQWVSLFDKGETIGAVLCTRDNVKPLYISIGHKLDLTTAIEIVMRCVTRYRLPETTRWAHRLSKNRLGF
jgi:deoxyribonuclease V